eukprot:SAG22_NODE_151_length_17414_cov_7.812128_7_plen_581_part_00
MRRRLPRDVDNAIQATGFWPAKLHYVEGCCCEISWASCTFMPWIPQGSRGLRPLQDWARTPPIFEGLDPWLGPLAPSHTPAAVDDSGQNTNTEEIAGTDRYLGMQCCCSKAVTFTSTHKLRRRNCSPKIHGSCGDLWACLSMGASLRRNFLANCKSRRIADMSVFLDPGPSVFRQSKALQALRLLDLRRLLLRTVQLQHGVNTPSWCMHAPAPAGDRDAMMAAAPAEAGVLLRWLLIFLKLLLAAAAGGGAPPAAVFVAADPAHQLAALELQRYLHLSSSSGLAACEVRVGAPYYGAGAGALPAHGGVALLAAETWGERLPALALRQPGSGGSLAPDSVARLEALSDRLSRGGGSATDDHALLSISTASGRRIIVVLGATDTSVLMGAYSLVERLTPVRFQLHGDILPDRTGLLGGSQLPALAEIFDAGYAGLGGAGVVLTPGDVSVRGLQPFHDFAEGPDWWNTAEYKLLLDQMAKMKLNMIALHTYPQNLVQPTVWTGLETDFNHTTGRLKKNGSYGAGYITTAGEATWGGIPMKSATTCSAHRTCSRRTATVPTRYGAPAAALIRCCRQPRLRPTSG